MLLRRCAVATLLLGAATRTALAQGLRLGIEAGAGLAHELAGVDLVLRWGAVSVFIPFGPRGFANVFGDGAPTAAGGIRYSFASGLTLGLQGAAVWTPRSASAEDAGFEAALAPTIGWRLQSGAFFAHAGAGPVVSYGERAGFGLRSLPHRRNWFREWPLDLDFAAGVEF
jgi:hypothetical protein